MADRTIRVDAESRPELILAALGPPQLPDLASEMFQDLAQGDVLRARHLTWLQQSRQYRDRMFRAVRAAFSGRLSGTAPAPLDDDDRLLLTSLIAADATVEDARDLLLKKPAGTTPSTVYAVDPAPAAALVLTCVQRRADVTARLQQLKEVLGAPVTHLSVDAAAALGALLVAEKRLRLAQDALDEVRRDFGGKIDRFDGPIEDALEPILVEART